LNTSENKLKNYSEVLDTKYGADGTSERLVFEQKAYDFIQAWYYIKPEKKLK